MPTASGLVLSSLLGFAARRIQVQLIGKQYPRAWNRVPGYILSGGFFVSGYLVCDHFIQDNQKLLERRLNILREQRAKKDIFYEFEEQESTRLTPETRSVFFKLLDKYGAPYK